MGDQATSVDAIAVKGIAARVQELFAAPGTFLSFPLAPVAYLAEDLQFLTAGGLSAMQAQTLGEFSELVNRIPLASQVWSDDGTGRHLWDVYADLLGAELATSERSPAEEEDYQRAYAYLHTGSPDMPSSPSQALLDYQAGQAAYLISETASRNGVGGPDAAALVAARDKAWQDWKVTGHKDDVEEAALTLSTLGDKDPSVAWSRYRTQFDPGMPAAFQTAPAGFRYATTGFAPSSAMTVPWSHMSMDGGALVAAAASASADLVEALAGSTTTDTVKELSFEFTAVDIIRPWLDTAMFTSRAWRFRSDGDPLSDGGTPPSGRCTAYVAKLILARSITVTRTRAAPSGLAFVEPTPKGSLADRFEPAPIPVALEVPAEVMPAPKRVQFDRDRMVRADRHGPATRLAVGRADRLEMGISLRRRMRPIDKERAILEPVARQAIESVQRFDFAASQILVPERTAPARPPAAEDEVVSTPADVVFVIAFGCRLLGASPNPDPGLPWPS